jgi:hypothetical protein
MSYGAWLRAAIELGLEVLLTYFGIAFSHVTSSRIAPTRLRSSSEATSRYRIGILILSVVVADCLSLMFPLILNLGTAPASSTAPFNDTSITCRSECTQHV